MASMRHGTWGLELLLAALFAATSVCTAPGFRAAEAGVASTVQQAEETPDYALNDVHFHLTNYTQKGPPVHDFLQIMGNQVGRVALFGIPLQQKWDYYVSGQRAPGYYLHSSARLYYYSFVDAMIAEAYLGLSPGQRERFDPMITGFNPTDMYAVDHIRRVLLTYPGVFSGIGEFTVHKEFVSAKVAGHAASLTNPALDAILELAGEVGLVAILHNDIDIVYPPEGAAPVYLGQMTALLKAHPDTTIIWAHTGLGRVVRPPKEHLVILDSLLGDPAYAHVYFDISWDEVAKYVTQDAEATRAWADLINRYPERFLFGTDAVAPQDQEGYLKTYRDYEPLWAMLDARASTLVRKENYARLFDRANVRVREWEQARKNAHSQ